MGFSLKQRLSQTAQSSSAINNQICDQQNTLIARIEKDYSDGSITRKEYETRYRDAAQQIRDLTAALEKQYKR